MRTNPFLSQVPDRKEQIKKMKSEYSDRAYMIITNQLTDDTVSISNEMLFTLLF